MVVPETRKTVSNISDRMNPTDAQRNVSTGRNKQILPKTKCLPMGRAAEAGNSNWRHERNDLDLSTEARDMETEEQVETTQEVQQYIFSLADDTATKPQITSSTRQQIQSFVCPDLALLDSASTINEIPSGMAGDRSIKYGFSWVSENDTDEYDKENQCVYRENIDDIDPYNISNGSNGSEQPGLYPSPAFSEEETASSLPMWGPQDSVQ